MLYMFIYTTIGRMPTSITLWEILTKFSHRMTESTEKKTKKTKAYTCTQYLNNINISLGDIYMLNHACVFMCIYICICVYETRL